MFASGQNTYAQSYLTGSHQEPRFCRALWQGPLAVCYRVHLSPTGQDFSVWASHRFHPTDNVSVIIRSLGCAFQQRDQADVPANAEKVLTGSCLVYTAGLGSKNSPMEVKAEIKWSNSVLPCWQGKPISFQVNFQFNVCRSQLRHQV